MKLDAKAVAKIRQDFPLFQKSDLAYLDNSAMTQKPQAVINALKDYYESYCANVHRGVYDIAEKATKAFEDARETVAHFIGAPDSASVIFTKNGSEGVNLVAYAWGDKFMREGDEILITEMEHHSNMVPWQELAKRRGAVLKHVRYNGATGKPRWEDLPKLLTPKTKIVAFGHVSNSLGTINPVKEIIAQVRKLSKAVVLVDSAQGVPHMKIDVKDLDCDFLIFSGYKMLGPTGVGVLYGKKALLEDMNPFNSGGDMIRDVCLESAEWNDVPWKFEAGTSNIADVIALAAAVKYLEGIGMDAIREHELELTRYAMEKLSKIPGIEIYGTKTAEERGGIISFGIEGVHTHDVGTLLARERVAVRVGHHCNMPLMCALKVNGTTRASFYLYNTEQEIDRLAAAIPKVQKIFA